MVSLNVDQWGEKEAAWRIVALIFCPEIDIQFWNDISSYTFVGQHAALSIVVLIFCPEVDIQSSNDISAYTFEGQSCCMKYCSIDVLSWNRYPIFK